MKYYFILGKNQELSKNEIEAVLKMLDFRFQILDCSRNVLTVEVGKKINIEELNLRLGGTVKMGQIIGEIGNIEEFTKHFFKAIKPEQGKVHFGFSLYDLDSKKLSKYQNKLKSIAMDIKRKLREEHHLNSRWVVSKEPELSSVIVKKNQLLKYGSEFCFFIKQNKLIIGQTLAVQLFEEFGARDFTRPGRDDLSGMLPPKLAKMMLNLSGVNNKGIILDPFCGSGTILQEAALMGEKDFLGFDNSDKAVSDTNENLEWLIDKYQLENIQYEVKKNDVNKLGDYLKQNSIESIITEPYLGPPIKGNEDRNKIIEIKNDLEKLYLSAFAQFKIVLKKKGKVVIVFPYWHDYDVKLEIMAEIEHLGFKLINQLIYSRHNQHVWRQIIVLTKI